MAYTSFPFAYSIRYYPIVIDDMTQGAPGQSDLSPSRDEWR